MSPSSRSTVIIAVFVLISACGGGGSPGTTGSTGTAGSTGTPTTTPGVSAGAGSCAVTLTGDLEESRTFAQAPHSFTSDYWLSEEDLRETFELFLEEGSADTFEDAQTRGDTVVGWFTFSCSDIQDLRFSVLIAPTNATGSDGLPMGPGTYRISGGIFDADGPAGTVIADLAVGGDEVYGTVPDSGELAITRWDSARLQGSATFDVVEAFPEGEPRRAKVSVTFDFECAPWHTACG